MIIGSNKIQNVIHVLYLILKLFTKWCFANQLISNPTIDFLDKIVWQSRDKNGMFLQNILCPKTLLFHWIFCYMYPIALQCIKRKVEILYAEFIHLKDYVHTKKKDK